jgi:cytochrome c oxidase assembly protein subunit 15
MTESVTTTAGPAIAARPVVAQDRAVGLWLLICALMIFAMVVLGGITRLSGSGLSIMEWNPLMGALPPMNDAEWNRVFGLYQGIAQYKHINPDMTLPEFKGIFWWEWSHRLWGRLIGIVFFLPFLYFLVRGYFRKRQGSAVGAGRLAAIFVLGALQGAVGWYMVASGFEDRDSVSQYRLVVHLLMALLIYALILWSALDLLDPEALDDAQKKARRLKPHGWLLIGAIALEITLGGLVAGLHGGLIYNDFPLMNGAVVAPDVFGMSPWWLSITENPGTAQFLHRCGALLVTVLVLALVVRASMAQVLPGRTALLALGLFAQVGLGIATLILVVPLPLAVMHQAGAVLLLSFALWFQHGLKRLETAR